MDGHRNPSSKAPPFESDFCRWGSSLGVMPPAMYTPPVQPDHVETGVFKDGQSVCLTQARGLQLHRDHLTSAASTGC